jgi:CRISPR system Cascade subunit CasE
MFLTKMPINPVRRGARTLLASPQALHAAVLAAFPDPGPTEEGRILWRLDTYERHKVVLYLASPDKPDLTHIVEQAGWPTTQTWETQPYDAFLESLRSGQQWQFRLTANPVHAVRRDGWSDTKPLAHVTVTQQQQWLLERAPRLGLRIVPSRAGTGAEPDLAVIDRRIHRFHRSGSTITISTATYQGHLEITETTALRHALTRGIGRAKAYGCGLLTLARPRTGP